MHLHFHREAPFALVGLVEQVGQGARIFAGPRESRATVRLERIHGHNPGRDRGGEALAEERSQWLVLPSLDVPRRPVVEQYRAEHMLERIANGDRLAQSIAGAGDKAELDLVVEPLAG